MLARIRKAMEEREGGFTLIELLVVIIIIGILAAIAIPTFLNQREKAWKKALAADLRNNASQMEAFFDENNAYPTAAPTSDPYKFKTSDSNQATTVGPIATSNPSGYCLQVTSKKTFTGNTMYLSNVDGVPKAGTCPTS
ncbi:MAG TPA: prepilin-type N-terminal cleavage/methylation domain-containing protein [Mycobacteriales bacterium]|nr:prepilin-type N-terminal cleavage/methylation domain-containing protein [Mycobacteriales bacterium]